MVEKRSFLFLQGPPGPFFRRLADAMREKGIPVFRINLSGGDRFDWPTGALNFRGPFSDWPVFFDKFLREHEITDLLLYGDCRPYHVSAHGLAARRRIRIHVLEEGYLRPHWMTLERNGVNARSNLSRDKAWFLKEASLLPEEPHRPPVTASFRRRAHDTYWYYHHVFFGRFGFPHFRSHRGSPMIVEGLGWLWKMLNETRRRTATDRVTTELMGKPFFLLPLQLSGDYQIRAHSPFPDMQSAARFVIESFRGNASPETHLLLKAHPLDCSFFSWPRLIAHEARRLRMQGRIHFVDGGDLENMARESEGLVCVNSTSATLGLANDTPVCALGDAVYGIAGLTHQGHLDSFWRNPTAPEPGLYLAFKRVLLDRCLVRGGLASESAVQALLISILEKLRL